MEEAVAVREIAVEALADIEPDRFRETLSAFVEDGSMVPGVLTLLVGGAVGTGGEGLSERAAGVQLVYDGLRLTRRLAGEEPWDAGADAAQRADLDVLAAVVLVARGFSLLARSAAADDAVAVVRNFGRDRSGDSPDADLERDVLELTLSAGADGAPVPAAARALADDVDVEHGTGTDDRTTAGFPPAAALVGSGLDALRGAAEPSDGGSDLDLDLDPDTGEVTPADF